MIFHSHANKTHFHKKGCALGLILKVRVFGPRKWPIGSLLSIFNCFKILQMLLKFWVNFLLFPCQKRLFYPIKINKLYLTFDSCKKCLNGLRKFEVVVGKSPGKFVFVWRAKVMCCVESWKMVEWHFASCK